jgi:hypothetical protein
LDIGKMLSVLAVVTFFASAPAYHCQTDSNGLFQLVAQQIIDKASIALPNATIVPCSMGDKHGVIHSWLLSSATIHVPGPFTALLHPYKTKLSTTTCGSGMSIKPGSACKNPNTTVLGTYMAPAMDLKPGKNDLTFTADMDLSVAQGAFLPSVVMDFVIPMFQNNKQMSLTVESEDLTITAGVRLGGKNRGIIRIPGLKLKHELTCTKVGMLKQTEVPKSICQDGTPEESSPYEIHCTAGVTTTASEESSAFVV